MSTESQTVRAGNQQECYPSNIAVIFITLCLTVCSISLIAAVFPSGSDHIAPSFMRQLIGIVFQRDR